MKKLKKKSWRLLVLIFPQSKVWFSFLNFLISHLRKQKSKIFSIPPPPHLCCFTSASVERWTFLDVLSHPRLVRAKRENFDGKGLSLWETRPSPRLLLSCGVFAHRTLTGKVSGPFLMGICIPQWRVTAPKGQEKTGPSIGSWKPFEGTDEQEVQRAPHPCKPPLALKNRTSLNCATLCLYQGVDEGEGWSWGVLDQSFTTERLLTRLRLQRWPPAYKNGGLSPVPTTWTTPRTPYLVIAHMFRCVACMQSGVCAGIKTPQADEDNAPVVVSGRYLWK